MQPLPTLEPGKYFHIFNRGNNRENLFLEERNYSYFLELFFRHAGVVSDLYVYCLMKNHFHLLVRIRTPEDQHKAWELRQGLGNVPRDFKTKDPIQQYSNWFNSYAKSINKAYDRTGSLFQERFGRREVEGRMTLQCVVQYIHLNPQKHRFVKDFRTYQHSSYGEMVSDGPTLLKRDEVLAWFGGRSKFDKAHALVAGDGMIHTIEGDEPEELERET